LLDITVDGSPRSHEEHHESVQSRLLYIVAELKIYSDGLIITIDAHIERYCKN